MLAVGTLIVGLVPSISAQTATNFGISASDVHVSGDIVAFDAAEFWDRTDYNNDGDTSDLVVHVIDTSTGDVTNLGIVGFWIQNNGKTIAFAVDEFSQGRTDFNNDGDASDKILHTYDVATGVLTNHQLHVDRDFKITDDILGFLVIEFGSGDLNDDGDITDTVIHVLDLNTGIITNTKAASDILFQVAGDKMAIPVYEIAQGNTDLDGDGDIRDLVLFAYDGTTTTNTAIPLDTSCCSRFYLSEDVIAASVFEGTIAPVGTVDLNEDGDAFNRDFVMFVYDFATGTVTNTKLAGSVFGIDATTVPFVLHERNQGETDFNGDGDFNDFVYHVIDVSDGSITNLGIAGTASYRVNDKMLAFNVIENSQGQTDFNSDGDASDLVLQILDLSNGVVTNTGIALNQLYLEIDDEIVAFGVIESNQDNTILNGDSDTADTVLHTFDLGSGVIKNKGLAIETVRVQNVPVQYVHVDDGFVAVTVSESQQGQDLNGDGDMSDSVLHTMNAKFGGVTNEKLATAAGNNNPTHLLEMDLQNVLFTVLESAQFGVDINGDGDALDAILHHVKVSKTIEEAISDLEDFIVGLGLPHGTETSLLANLKNIPDIINDGNPDNDDSVCGKLYAFIDKVQAQYGKNISADDADQLIAQAQDILDSLGC